MNNILSKPEFKRLTITVVERSPKDLMGNGPAVPALVDFLKRKGLAVNLIHHVAYGDKFGVEKADGLATLVLPRRWPRWLKALAVVLFNLVYSYRYARSNRIIEPSHQNIICCLIIIYILTFHIVERSSLISRCYTYCIRRSSVLGHKRYKNMA